LLQSLLAESFGSFARQGKNGFVALTDCFMTVSRRLAACPQQKEPSTFR